MPGLDTGDILLQKEIPIAPDDTAETLAPRLATIGADLTVETLQASKPERFILARRTTVRQPWPHP